jgi:uncharacterized membrane protein
MDGTIMSGCLLYLIPLEVILYLVIGILLYLHSSIVDIKQLD